jgi:uncharacterized protein
MNKKHYVLYLTPPRPNFAQTMTAQESAIMQRHLVFWNEAMKRGKVLAFGPVMDKSGFYGLGIVEVDSEDEVKFLIANDPAAKINKYEYYLMNAVVPAR